jgi:hypothetical protein
VVDEQPSHEALEALIEAMLISDDADDAEELPLHKYAASPSQVVLTIL